MSFFKLWLTHTFAHKIKYMSVIYGLLAISVVVAVIFLVVFILSVRSGQYDDSYTPSIRMLFEDELVSETPNSTKSNKQKK